MAESFSAAVRGMNLEVIGGCDRLISPGCGKKRGPRMYKKSQLTRLDRLAAMFRALSRVLVGLSALIFVVLIGPTFSLTGQLILGSGIFVFAWLMLLSLMRKQTTSTRNTQRDTRKYSLDFD